MLSLYEKNKISANGTLWLSLPRRNLKEEHNSIDIQESGQIRGLGALLDNVWQTL